MAMMAKKKKYSKIFHLGYQHVDLTIAYNSYLLKAADTFVLFDLPPASKIKEILEAIRKITTIDKIKFLVIQNTTISLINVINYLQNEGFSGTIVTNFYLAKQIKNAGITLSQYIIDQNQFKLALDEELMLDFFPMAFLPYPQMFFTYFPRLFTLLSSTLFSSHFNFDTTIGLDALKKNIFSLEKVLFPSSDYLRQPLKVIAKLDVKNILPALGVIIPETMTKEVIDFVAHTDFFNTYRMIQNEQDGTYQINFDEMLNQMINTLLKHYRKDIIAMFKDSPITIDSDSLSVQASSLAGYPLWNTFFEVIFNRLGMEGLFILEPAINALSHKYQVELPALVKAQLSIVLKENERMKARQNEQEATIASLTTQVEETRQAMYKDASTKILNQAYFKEQLKKDLAEPLLDGYVRGALLIHLDQLNDINRKYSKEMGDEALRNLVYVMEKYKDESSTILFKQNGPGIIVYKPNTTLEKLRECAVKLRNAVDNSRAFIERVTVSAAVVDSSELNPQEPVSQQANQIIALLEKRIRHANQLGHASIVDATTNLGPEYEGVVLLIDEDEINRNMLQRIFARIHLEVLLARDVEEAMRLIKTTPVDLIISEINLSKMDGFSLKRQLNETKEYRQIPFIMVSHSKTVENIRRGNLLDVDVILEKPIIPEELLGFVKRFRERKSNV